MDGRTDGRTDGRNDGRSNISVSVRAVPELIVGGWGWRSDFSAKPRCPCFAYQWPDNVKMLKVS